MKKNKKTESQISTPAINFVAKYAGINRASTHVDKKKQQQTPRKLKHKQTFDY